MTETVSSAVEKVDNSPGAMILSYHSDFSMVLPTQIRPDTWVRLAQGVLRRNKELARVASNNPGSLMRALLECARLGHEPGTDAFYLVPIGGEVEGWEGYKGVIQRMLRSGKVANVKAEFVCANDRFDYEPDLMAKPIHRADWFGDRGEVIGSYAYAEMTDGTTSKIAIADKSYIARVRAMQPSNKKTSSPWVKWYESMVIKCAVNRLEPFVDTSAEDLRLPIKAQAVVEAPAPVAPPVIASAPEAPALPPSTPTGDENVEDADVVEDGAPTPAASSQGGVVITEQAGVTGEDLPGPGAAKAAPEPEVSDPAGDGTLGENDKAPAQLANRVTALLTEHGVGEHGDQLAVMSLLLDERVPMLADLRIREVRYLLKRVPELVETGSFAGTVERARAAANA